MNLAKSILGRLFALWAALLFVSSLLVVALFLWAIGLLPEPRRSKALHTIFVIWMDFFFFFSGVRREFKGREYFARGQNYVVVCNHNSYMDVPLTSPGIPGANKTIAKVEMSHLPIFGLAYKRGSVLVDRKSEESRKRSYVKMKEVLEMGLHMCIYPEGTRNKTKEPLQRFHDGAFRLAVETGKPIIPAVIFNTNTVMPRHKSFYFWPSKVGMHFLQPVTVTGKTVAEVREEVFLLMKNYYVQNRGAFSNSL